MPSLTIAIVCFILAVIAIVFVGLDSVLTATFLAAGLILLGMGLDNMRLVVLGRRFTQHETSDKTA